MVIGAGSWLQGGGQASWLLVYNGRNAGGPYALGFARSSSPIGPWVYQNPDAPAISAPAPYESLGKPSLVATPSGYHLHVEALRDMATGLVRDILLFTSDDGQYWTAPEQARVVLHHAGLPAALNDAADATAPFKLWYQDSTLRIALAQSSYLLTTTGTPNRKSAQLSTTNIWPSQAKYNLH